MTEPGSESPGTESPVPRWKRRQLLWMAPVGGVGALLSGCDAGGLEAVIHQVWEPVNQTVEEAIFSPQRLAPEFPETAIEPEKLLVNDLSTNAGLAVPAIDPQTYRLQVFGEIPQERSFSLAELQALTPRSVTMRHVCVEGWAAIVKWTGVPLQAIAAQVQPQESVRYVYFFSGDGYYESWDLASALHPQTLLAYGMNHAPLAAAHGAPLRLASPIKLGYKQSKWVMAIAFVSQLTRRRGYWEDQGYEWYAGL